MRKQTIQLTGILAVVFSAVLGCDKAPPTETDVYMQKICTQLDAINEMLDDGNKEMAAIQAGDTNAAAMWETKRKEAYRRTQQ